MKYQPKILGIVGRVRLAISGPPIGYEAAFCGHTILIGYERKSFVCNTRIFG